MHEVFNKLREHAEKDLRALSQKADISANEWSNAKTLLSAMCKMDQLEMNMNDDYEVSTRRGRSSRTGRYVSMDNRPYYDNRMSGHSITDRMVDQIERMYDTARTDHERRELDKWIDRIRNGD